MHIAMMRDEVVDRRRWLTDDEFLDLLGATQLIPGPNSTEMALHVGWKRRGLRGLLVAGLAFIAPAAAITCAFAWAYSRYAMLPVAHGVMRGIQPVVLAIVLHALFTLAPKAARTTPLRIVGLACAVAHVAGLDEVWALLAAGLGHAAWTRMRSTKAMVPLGALAGAASNVAPPELPSIFGVFLKIGSVLFGSGYVLVAFLRSELVERRHWIDEAQLLDAIAVGQVTPGPVFTSATFLGWILRGPSGALAATTGIFLPAFVLVAASGRLVPKLRSSKVAGAFLDGVNVASLVLMATAAIELGRGALLAPSFDPVAAGVLAIATALLLRTKVHPTWLVAGGAGVGAVSTWLRG